MSAQAITNNEIIIGKSIKVIRDKKSGARVINIPFDFPTGDRGVIIVCRLRDQDWVPVSDLLAIDIKFRPQ